MNSTKRLHDEAQGGSSNQLAAGGAAGKDNGAVIGESRPAKMFRKDVHAINAPRSSDSRDRAGPIHDRGLGDGKRLDGGKADVRGSSVGTSGHGVSSPSSMPPPSVRSVSGAKPMNQNAAPYGSRPLASASHQGFHAPSARSTAAAGVPSPGGGSSEILGSTSVRTSGPGTGAVVQSPQGVGFSSGSDFLPGRTVGLESNARTELKLSALESLAEKFKEPQRNMDRATLPSEKRADSSYGSKQDAELNVEEERKDGTKEAGMEKEKDKEQESDRSREGEREKEIAKEKDLGRYKVDEETFKGSGLSAMDIDKTAASEDSSEQEKRKGGRELERGKAKPSWEWEEEAGKVKDKEQEENEEKDEDEVVAREERERVLVEPGSAVGEEGGEKEVTTGSAAVPSAERSKRVLRPRQVSGSREARSRYRNKDPEGAHGRSELAVLQYREGEGMPELCKLLKDSEGGDKDAESPSPSQLAEMAITAEALTTKNRQVRGRQLWGTDIYTDDSDIVAVLMHTGFYTPGPVAPPPAIAELRATLRVMQPQDSYKSSMRNNMRSRAWGAARGNCSYSVERCRIIKVGGGSLEVPALPLNGSPAVPTLAPAALERTVTTRAASQNAARQQRLIQEVTVQYNLCNEPWLKYNMSVVADRGLKPAQFTSARLKKADVLYLETQHHRYELCYQGEGEALLCNGADACVEGYPNPWGGERGAQMGQEGDEEAQREEEGEQEKVNAERHKSEAEPGREGREHGAEGENGRKMDSNEQEDKERDHHVGERRAGNHHSDKGRGSPHGRQSGPEGAELFRWTRCRRPLPLATMRAKGCPLPADCVEVVEEGLRWEEIEWANNAVFIRGREYPLARAHFMPRRPGSEH